MRGARALERSWFDDVRAQGVARVAPAFGLELVRIGADLSFQCPAPGCGRLLRHTKGGNDKRRAAKVVHEGRGWWCEPCGATGNAVDLAALVVKGHADPGREGWPDVRRACAERGLCDPDPLDTRPPPAVRRLEPPPMPEPAPIKRLPAAELAALWSAGIRPAVAASSSLAPDRAAAAYLAHRGVNLGDLDLWESDLCRILPAPGGYAFPTWWPSNWAGTWRWAVLAYEPDGTVGSIHARAITDSADPKTRWPAGAAAGGLLFADSRGVAFLRGDSTGVDAVLVAEGLSDMVAWSLWAHRTGRRRAVLGVTSGSAQAFERVSWPDGLPCYVATDNDKQGDNYAAEVRAALPARVRVLRLRLEQTEEVKR